MRAWAEQRTVAHRYIGICSDTRAGRDDEDASLRELEIPVTTDPTAICAALQDSTPDAMTVVFSTYESLGLVEQAQDDGAPPFDLVLCDEAHRTTDIERPGDRTSPFVLVHDADRIRASRRLYMTATPRLYTEGAKSKAAQHAVDVFSMDDERTYGPQFHRLPFSRAVDQGLLSDYKVVVLAMSEEHVNPALQSHLASSDSEINLDDAAKIVGCWRALQNPENRTADDGPIRPLRRAIAFTNTIRSSRRLATHWGGLVEQAVGVAVVAVVDDDEATGDVPRTQGPAGGCEPRPARAARDGRLKAEIRRVWTENRRVYGSRKVWRQFAAGGLRGGAMHRRAVDARAEPAGCGSRPTRAHNDSRRGSGPTAGPGRP